MSSILQIAEERQRINDTIRVFFRSRGYVEVETPLLVASPDVSPNLQPFETKVMEPTGATHRAALITSPEFSMKKLLGKGIEKIFTLTKVFRNGEAFSAKGGSASGGGGHHNPEFTMLEFYQQGADYQACMDETEALLRSVFSAFPLMSRPGHKLEDPFRRVRLRDLFLTHTGIDLDTADREDFLRVLAATTFVPTGTKVDTMSDLFYRVFLAKIEPKIGSSPTFVYDYPKYQAALSKLTPDGRYGERFELYMNGMELCNGFTELTDAKEQRARFESELAERRALGKPTFPIDEELLRLLPSVRQPTFGNALGVDRLHMVATGRSRIEEVLLFPARTLFRGS
jgi:lysyl-tRNA synthetase class 2